MPYFWDYMNFGRNQPQNQRNLQDGLFQIASQTCSLLVQVNNTNNISFGNNSTNVHCNNLQPNRPKLSRDSSRDDEQFMVLLPSSSKGPGYKPSHRSRSKLTTVLENGSFSHEDDADFFGQGYAFKDDDTIVKRWSKSKGWCNPSCIPISIILILIFLVVLLPLLDHALEKDDIFGKNLISNESCTPICGETLFVETIPEGLVFPNVSNPVSTFETWKKLISVAEKTIEIASFYWTLQASDVYPSSSSAAGQEIFDSLLRAGTERGIKIKIVQSAPTQEQPNLDTELLVKRKAAEVRSVNFAQLLGAGVLHTKLWIIDRNSIYIGSANMDWRALTQVKELGAASYNCSCLAEDAGKIFDILWRLGTDAKIPDKWPEEFSTKINMETPGNITFNNETFLTYLSSSPPPLSAEGRTDDIAAILNIINQAEKFIYIAVMDYFPLTIYTPKVRYWPVIDDAIRKAAIEHKVNVKMLISWWNQSRPSEDYFLRSLVDVADSFHGVSIEVRRFIVPATSEQAKIPFARVNHNKYMVTDNTAYIGTSNWSGDYFINTAGVGFILHDPVINRNSTERNLRQQLQDVFERDWNSEYSHPLNNTPSAL